MPREIIGERQALGIGQTGRELVIALFDFHALRLAGKKALLHQRDRFGLLTLRILDRRKVDQRGQLIGVDRQRLIEHRHRLVDLPSGFIAPAKIGVARREIGILRRSRGGECVNPGADRDQIIGIHRGMDLLRSDEEFFVGGLGDLLRGSKLDRDHRRILGFNRILELDDRLAGFL